MSRLTIIFAFSLFCSISGLSADPLRIMPLGDSITEGWVGGQSALQDGSGYRSMLWQSLTDRGIDFDFVGSQTSLRSAGATPPVGFDRDHEGYAGYWSSKISEPNLNSGVGGWLSTAMPDVVLLMSGTNDIIRSATPTEAVIDLDILLDSVRGFDSSMELFVATLPRSSWVSFAKIDTFNAGIRALVEDRSMTDSKLHLVDMAAVLDFGLHIGDGVHPNFDGYSILADQWEIALDVAVLNSSPLSMPEPENYLVLGSLLAISLFLKRKKVEARSQPRGFQSQNLTPSKLRK
jgi:lysophospholipase L1-like esterase